MDERNDTKPASEGNIKEIPKESGPRPLINQETLSIVFICGAIVAHAGKLITLEVAASISIIVLIFNAWDFVKKKVSEEFKIKKMSPLEIQKLVKEKFLEIHIRFRMENFKLKQIKDASEPLIYLIKGYTIEKTGVELPCIVEIGFMGREIERFEYNTRYIELNGIDWAGYSKESAPTEARYTYISSPKRVQISDNHDTKETDEEEEFEE